MKKVTDLKDNEVIHCKTEPEAIQICKLMNEAGLTWNEKVFFHIYKDNTCYIPNRKTYCSLVYCKEQNSSSIRIY